MTEELFLRDAYLCEFEARVDNLDGREVVLNRTVFYPGGGGQPPDKGYLVVGPIRAKVVDARRGGDGIIHVLDNAIPKTVRALKGTLDWERRYAHMRHHTALYVLSTVARRDFDAQVTGARMRAAQARVDFSSSPDLTESNILEMERRANKVLADERSVAVYELPRKETPYNPPPDERVPHDTESVRVVEVEGLEARADGGTHVSNTREVGRVEITGHENTRNGSKRVEFVLR